MPLSKRSKTTYSYLVTWPFSLNMEKKLMPPIANFNAFSFRGEFFVYGVHGPRTPIVERRAWEIKAFNYDNCAAAMITLFAVQTSEGWVE